jgi:outer membrane protein
MIKNNGSQSMTLKIMKTSTALIIFAFSVGISAIHAEIPPIPDNSLNSMLDYAMEHNFDIQQAREQIREQQGLIVELTAAALPNIGIDASYSIDDEGLVTGGVSPGTGADKYWSVHLQVNQLVYSGGQVGATLRAQKFAEDAIEYALKSTIEQVVYNVSYRFYDALLAREQIEVEQQNVQYLEEQLKTAQDRFSAKTISKFDVLRAEVELANSQPALISAKNSYRIAVDELYNAIGHQNTDPLNYDGREIEGELSFQPFDFSLQSAMDEALQYRPEMLQLDTMIQAREAGIDIAKAGYFPTVSVYGSYGVEKNPYYEEFNDSNKGWSVGIQSSWSIFDGRATRGKMIQARSQLRQAELDKRQLQFSIEVEVRRAISALQEAEELASAANKVVEQAEEALRLAEVRYEAGAATQLELLQTRVSLTQAKTNLLSANYSFLLAAAQYRKAIGAVSR